MRPRDARPEGDLEGTVSRWRLAIALPLGGGLALALVAAIAARRVPSIDLAAATAEAIPASGVEHPITAVLLQFRGYDTLLEIAVLLAAALVALALREEPAAAAPRSRAPTAPAPAVVRGSDEHDLIHPGTSDRAGARAIETPLLATLTRALHPALLLLAIYLLWAGATRPGGAFQSGAVLAALGVLRRVSGVRPWAALLDRWQHAALLVGFAVFLGLAAGMLLLDRPLLGWPSASAGALILAIEAALTVSIAANLVGLFASAPDGRDAAARGADRS